MTRLHATSVCVLAVAAFSGLAQPESTSLVDFEMMTWPEVKHALEQGKTTIQIYTAAPGSAARRTSTAATLSMGHVTAV